MEQPQTKERPEILIIGAGIAGLMMGILCESIGIKYHIYERASEVKPLGSAMALGVVNFVALEQLGIYDDLLKIAKPFGTIYFMQGDGEYIGQMTRERIMEKFGYNDLVFSRPDFYEVLRKRVPVEKISFKKKVLNIEEKNDKVFIHCEDNTSYSGDILIGADGAYSGVRQSMYKQMNEKKLLPKEDLEDFSIGYTVVVGVAKADPEKHPILKEKNSKFCQVIFDGDSNCYVVPLPNNQVGWGLGTQLSNEEINKLQSRGSGWNADTGESTIKPFRDLPSPVGGTMGELFDATPQELISKVYLEEKLFKTWHHGRIALVGDACHKLHPAGGQGAANAMHDAVVLANCIYLMKDNSGESIYAAFADYFDQRFKHAELAYNMSSHTSKFLNGQKFWEKILRKIVLNYIPTRLYDWFVDGAASYRPQVAWLPLLKSRGIVKVDPQPFEKLDCSYAVSV
ncbi:hypothetical protein BGZ76_006775 [Entomortierella beljakovae]|nr:hypothetical protein BGZ76_006775 [Entomortierella beljakovae]